MNYLSNSKKYIPGIFLSLGIAAAAYLISSLLPAGILGETLVALIIGILLNPIAEKFGLFKSGINFTSKKILKFGIILAGVTLSFPEVLKAGKYALILMAFTLVTSFGVGFICKKIFKINWKLASLLSISTAICGGTAVATLGPTIKAKEKDIAYAISATFIFDLITVIAFPYFGKLIGLSDTGYGLWVGTAVNDTSSVVAAGYAFSDIAGALATIVKLTRTLFIVPIVLIFSFFYAKKELKDNADGSGGKREKVNIVKIFPWFILLFIGVAAIRSIGIIPDSGVGIISSASKFLLATALASIGMKTSFKEVKSIGIKPMLAGVIIDTSVVFVSLGVQALILNFVK